MRDDSQHRLRVYREQLEKLRMSIRFDGVRTLSHVGKIALVCIARNEDRYIDEWIDYHFKLGVDEIFIYENEWKSNVKRERVHTIPFDGKSKQVYAYNDFIFRRSEGFEWVIFIDVDEFLCLNKHNSIQEFLRDYGNLPDEADAIAINWMVFGDNNAPSEGSVLERFTRRAIEPERNVKLIMKLNGDRLMLGPHHSYGFWIDTNGYIGIGQNNFKGTCDVAQINHYYCKTKKEYDEKVERGRADWYIPRNDADFDYYNKNEVEDLTALNFYKGK